MQSFDTHVSGYLLNVGTILAKFEKYASITYNCIYEKAWAEEVSSVEDVAAFGVIGAAFVCGCDLAKGGPY